MEGDFFIGVAQQALWILALASAPILIPALIAGLILGMIQAATSINEQTLTFVPKLIVVAICLAIFGGSIMVLISDLIEGGVRDNLIRRAGAMVSSGVSLITLLALSDDGAPMYDHQNAAALAALGSPAFACTPDLFPSLMAAAIGRQDVATWAAANNIALGARAEEA